MMPRTPAPSALPLRFLALAALLLALIMPSAGHGQQQAPKKTELEWSNLTHAVAKGAAQQKPIMVDIYTDWCGWCKKMDKEVFAHPEVAEVLANSFTLAKVNGESRESITYKGQKTDGVGIARGFGVRGYPSIAFLDAKGDLLTMIPGFMDAGRFLPILMFIGNKEYEKMEWETFLSNYNASRKTPPGSR